jgi:hypothetical protein
MNTISHNIENMANMQTKPPKRRATPKKDSIDGAVVKVGNLLTVVGEPANVAEYLMSQIKMSGKTQIEIAQDVGFPMPNMITMLKKGLSKLPMDKVGLMAKSVGVDPVHLYKLCMEEYYPSTWEMLQGFLSQPTLTKNELEFIHVIRKSALMNPKLRSEKDENRLLDFISSLDAKSGTSPVSTAAEA